MGQKPGDPSVLLCASTLNWAILHCKKMSDISALPVVECTFHFLNERKKINNSKSFIQKQSSSKYNSGAVRADSRL